MNAAKINGLHAIAVLSICCYIGLGYFVPRSDFTATMFFFVLLFAAYLFILYHPLGEKQFWALTIWALGFRLILLFSIPQLSDDFHRFFWDGRLIHLGLNPYTHTPEEIIGNLSAYADMNLYYQGMNSRHYYSVYPPLAQLTYYLATFFPQVSLNGTIVLYRLMVIGAELAMIPAFFWLLNRGENPRRKILIYFLNPFVILEFTGNLHGEVFVILCMLYLVRFLIECKIVYAAAVFGLAVAMKLTPLIFLPSILRYLNFRKGFQFSLLSSAVVLSIFLPFISSDSFAHIGRGIALYYNNFEFNSFITNVLRFIPEMKSDSANIPTISRILSVAAFVLILLLSFRFSQKTPEAIFRRISLILLIYLFSAMNVHPWYISPLVAFAVFIPLQYGPYWSFLIFPTYITYVQMPFQQNVYVILLEYAAILGIFCFYKFRKFKIA